MKKILLFAIIASLASCSVVHPYGCPSTENQVGYGPTKPIKIAYKKERVKAREKKPRRQVHHFGNPSKF